MPKKEDQWVLTLGIEAHGNIRPRRRAAGASRATALHIMLTNKRNVLDSPTAPLRHLSLFGVMSSDQVASNRRPANQTVFRS